MPSFPRKTLAVGSAGHTYDYICIKPTVTTPSKSAIVFFHGFPAIADIWSRQIKYFADLGHTVIAPDLLGFGGSSKPHAVEEYTSWTAVEDIVGILDAEGLEKVHGVGHDAGAYFLSRLYNYHPGRLYSLTFLSVPYSAPGVHYDLDAISAILEKFIGFDKLGYMRFLASSDSPRLIGDHLESFLSIAYHEDMDVRSEHFYPPGKLQAWLKADRVDHSLVLHDEDKENLIGSFRKGDWVAATNGYRLMAENLNEEREKADIADGKLATTIKVPVLGIDSQADKTSLSGSMQKGVSQFLDDESLGTFVTVPSQGHYPHVVSAVEVNGAIKSLVESIDA
ncbi:hypothetical protein N7478_004083 [Penicillium angulare]|uniref:uncharacterized protein n=1 Tax=Penicillium angulare TaxID=116970 RepID=UPI0025406548|nr:uncharacterized protein N7478_004083 [Penicillium angulare]KAJ5278711.1 hypothetical protein N7478_004083 [Penicillium angulare]